MKRRYEPPKAEKVVFDYTESVAACMSDGCACWYASLSKPAQPKVETKPTVENRVEQANQSNNYWKKTSTDYWGC